MTRKIYMLLLSGVLLIQAGLARAQETNAPAAANQGAADAATATDWNSFKIISQRNIFNPNRSARRSSTPPIRRAPRVESFTLVGTLSYDKGSFAFFDGTSSEYRKTLKPSDTIAGYRIAKIASDYVSLAGASNQMLRLPVGMQIKRPEGGRWAMAGLAESSPDASEPAPATSADAPPAAAAAAPASTEESDVMKRMMARRLSEK